MLFLAICVTENDYFLNKDVLLESINNFRSVFKQNLYVFCVFQSEHTLGIKNDLPKNYFDEVEFKVQVASGKNKIATKSYNFKGLKNIERVKVGGYYKYYYGNSTSYNLVKKALSLAKSKGYKSAFIVAVKNGEKISVKEALKMQ